MLNLAGTAGQSVEVAPGTVYLGSGVAPRYLKATTNVAAADTVNADELQPGGISGLNLDGSGVRIGIWDGGRVRLTHQEFGGRVVAGTDTSGNSSHATHVAGTIGASGVSATAKEWRLPPTSRVGISTTTRLKCQSQPVLHRTPSSCRTFVFVPNRLDRH